MDCEKFLLFYCSIVLHVPSPKLFDHLQKKKKNFFRFLKYRFRNILEIWIMKIFYCSIVLLFGWYRLQNYLTISKKKKFFFRFLKYRIRNNLKNFFLIFQKPPTDENIFLVFFLMVFYKIFCL